MEKQITRLSTLKWTFVILFYLCLSTTIFAQKATDSPSTGVAENENWLKFEATERFTLSDLANQKHRFGLAQDDDLQLVRSETDRIGYTPSPLSANLQRCTHRRR